jgi:hypothetical protein
MMFLSKDQFNTLVDKLDAIAKALDMIHAVYAAETKPESPKLVVHNNGHKKRKWHKRADGDKTVQSTVMEVMKDGLPRHRNKIVQEVNRLGTCRIKVRKETIGYAFTDLCSAGRLQRVGTGVYKAVA